MLLPSAERVPVKSIVTPPKASISDTLLPLTVPLILSLEKLGRIHARMTIILVDCTWDDSLRLAFTTSALVELPEMPEELEVNPKTQGLFIAAFDTVVGAPLPPPPLQPVSRKRNVTNKSTRRNSRHLMTPDDGFPESTPASGMVTVPTSFLDRRWDGPGGNQLGLY